MGGFYSRHMDTPHHCYHCSSFTIGVLRQQSYGHAVLMSSTLQKINKLAPESVTEGRLCWSVFPTSAKLQRAFGYIVPHFCRVGGSGSIPAETHLALTHPHSSVLLLPNGIFHAAVPGVIG